MAIIKQALASAKQRGLCACAVALAAILALSPLTAFAQGINDPLTETELQLSQASQDSAASARSLDDFWRWPLPGIGEDHISQDFWSGHGAIDIWAAKGTPIVASRAGTVVATEATHPMELDGYGNCVVIYHNDGTATYYAHMDSRAVNAGTTVTQGQLIGYVGNTGMSFGDHLHFEIRVNATANEFYFGERIDPLPYVTGHDYDVSTPDSVQRPFLDVPAGEWYEDSVLTAFEAGFMKGTGGYFRPNDTITRGEVYTILYRASGAEESEGTAGVPVENTSSFTDCGDYQYYTAAINWAARCGMASTVNTEVWPDDAITREDLAVLMARYASIVRGADVSASTSLLMTKADWQSIDSWAMESMAWTLENEIITGRVSADGGSLLDPAGTATRAEMAKVIAKTADLVG